MLLAGGANLLLAGAWMFGALLGSNAMDGHRGGIFLAGMALTLLPGFAPQVSAALAHTTAGAR